MALLSKIAVVAGLIVLGLACIPWRDPRARLRAAWLLLLPTPAVVLLVMGPMGLPSGGGRRALVLAAQPWIVVAAILLVLGAVVRLGGLRGATSIFGALAIVAAVAVAGANSLILDPSS